MIYNVTIKFAYDYHIEFRLLIDETFVFPEEMRCLMLLAAALWW